MLIVSILLYIAYITLATKALMCRPKYHNLRTGWALFMVICSLPLVPHMVIGNWLYNKWMAITAVLLLTVSILLFMM